LPIRLAVAAAVSVASILNLSARADNFADEATVQGTWIPAKAELAGSDLPDESLKAITLEIVAGSYILTAADEGKSDKGTYTLFADSNPKGLEVKSVAGPNKGKTFRAIYELKGDTMRVCYDLSGTKRPTEFKTAPGTSLYLVTYQRQGSEGASQTK
jgi:uncharacterized protein (TIGR03067 family)